MKQILATIIVAATLAVFLSMNSQVAAASKKETVASCEKPLIAKDQRLTQKAAVEILLLGKLFNQAARIAAVECLDFAFGVGWSYDEFVGAFMNNNTEIMDKALTMFTAQQKTRYDEVMSIAEKQRADAEAKKQMLETANNKLEAQRKAALIDKKIAERVQEIEIEREAKKRADELKLALAREAVTQKAVLACETIYRSDYVSAMTNPICFKLFYDLGYLPDQ